MKNKTFTVGSIFICYIILGGLVYFNYTFDSYGFFKQNNEVSFAAKAVATGNNIAGLENYDERLFQKQVFQNFEVYPETLIIGSSRTMMVQSSMLSNSNRTFNHSVSGASLEDYIAILGLYAQKKVLPKKVIFGIDPWIFNKNNRQSRWLGLSTEYNFILGEIRGTASQVVIKKDENKYFQLINFENTKNNFLHFKESHKIKIITDENIDSTIKRADGSIVYPFKTRFQKDTETQKLVKEYIVGEIYSLGNFKELSNIQLFEDFILFLTKNGVTVELFLPPYHPTVYNYFSNNYQYINVLKSEAYLRKFAKKHSLKVYGSYNPKEYGLTSHDFTDGMHGKSVVSQKILH